MQNHPHFPYNVFRMASLKPQLGTTGKSQCKMFDIHELKTINCAMEILGEK